jgi:hypothetical protein
MTIFTIKLSNKKAFALRKSSNQIKFNTNGYAPRKKSRAQERLQAV